MVKRVLWKKGMRLTDDLFKMSDAFHSDLAQIALTLGACGRFGLLPSNQPFRIVLDIEKNCVDVVSLECLGLTKSGRLLDVSFDSNYTGAKESRIQIPSQIEYSSLLLVALATGEWRDMNDGTCQPDYHFILIGEESVLPEDGIPVAKIVNDMGWREDDQSFVPPCLFLTAHSKYSQLSQRFKDMLAQLDSLVGQRLVTDSGDARRLFWPEVRRLKITMDKESDVMTPMSLLARVQECVSAFHLACTLDECLSLSEADKFTDYVQIPYNYQDAYLKIQEGLSLLFDVCKKLDDFAAQPKEQEIPIGQPYIPDDELHQYAVSNDVRVEVYGVAPGASCYYSIDGSEPTTPLQGGRFVPLNPGFNKTRTKEKDRNYSIQLKIVQDGKASRVITTEVVVTKDVNVWKGFQI